MAQESTLKTFAVATGVCVVCSVFVSTAAVSLKDRIARNQTLDKKKNILVAAGVSTDGDIEELFDNNVIAKVIEIETGQYVEKDEDGNEIDATKLNERKAAKDPERSLGIEGKDLAKLGSISKYQSVFFSKDGTRVILPVHGKGLWSTMYGFIALDLADLNTIKSLAFYEHGETPGLGGEVDSETWKESWIGKQAFDTEGQLAITVVKGKAETDAVHEADGLAGATLTARGVQHLVDFWLGPAGYGPFLDELEKEGGRDE